MTRQKCPDSLRKYGFCAILAIIYAANLQMPQSQADLNILLIMVKEALQLSASTWTAKLAKKQGGLSYDNILKLLRHYHCAFEIITPIVSESGRAPTLNKWLKSLPANSSYIVVVKKHALFVETKKSKRNWRVFDQSSIKDKTMKLKHGAHHICNVIKIL